MMGCDLYGLLLELKELRTKIAWYAVADYSFSRLLREVVGHLDVDMMRRNWHWPRPALIDDIGDFFRDVQAPFIIPAFIEPSRQLLAGVVICNVHVQLTLL